MGDLKEKSFDYANEALKLILTLATGVLAFTLTFMKDMIGENPIRFMPCLYSSWFLMVFSIACCLWGIFAIIGTANEIGPNVTSSTESVYSKNITVPTVVAISFFVAGMISMIIFTLGNFHSDDNSKEKKVKPKNTVICCRDSLTVMVNVQPETKKIVGKSAVKRKRKCNCRVNVKFLPRKRLPQVHCREIVN